MGSEGEGNSIDFSFVEIFYHVLHILSQVLMISLVCDAYSLHKVMYVQGVSIQCAIFYCLILKSREL